MAGAGLVDDPGAEEAEVAVCPARLIREEEVEEEAAEAELEEVWPSRLPLLMGGLLMWAW